jgi:hypothetical protein
MTALNRNDTHEAGVHYTGYMLAKFGFNNIETSDESPHVKAQKDGRAYSFHVTAITDEGAWGGYDNTDFKFSHLVVLTHILEEPNVYILKAEDVKGLIVLEKGRYWLNKEKFRNKGKHWNQI